MRTWWLYKTHDWGIEVYTVPGGWAGVAYEAVPISAIGPFWTYREAMEMMYRWS